MSSNINSFLASVTEARSDPSMSADAKAISNFVVMDTLSTLANLYRTVKFQNCQVSVVHLLVKCHDVCSPFLPCDGWASDQGQVRICNTYSRQPLVTVHMWV